MSRRPPRLGPLALVGYLPAGARRWLGTGLGAILLLALRRRRHVARRNLELVFPAWTAAQRRRLLRRTFYALGISVVDRLWALSTSAEQIRRAIRVRGGEILRNLRGQGVIAFAPHLCGMDVGFLRLSLDEGARVACLYKRQHHAYSDALLSALRTRFGGCLFERNDPPRRYLRWLQQGNLLGYLGDIHDRRAPSVFAPLLAVERAATLTSLMHMVRLSGAKVMPVTICRQPGGDYEMRYHPPWEDFPSGDLEQDARRINRFIGEAILAAPEQYHWLHRRFKVRPPGEPSPYAT